MEGKYLLFEGFLKKRKDSMRLIWRTYWFRLQNTTLFFYTKKDGSALHLRGLYYIYTVQSVREIQRDEEKRYLFEIIMKNGKRKVVAAETSDLRRDWISHLWRAMCLTSDPGSARQEMIDDLSGCDSRTGPLARAQGISTLPDQDQSGRGLSLSSEDVIYQNTLSSYDGDRGYSLCLLDGRLGDRQEVADEGDYDVLPARNSSYQMNQSEGDVAKTESLYAVPLNNRRAGDRQEYRSEVSESIYDVPKSFLGTTAAHKLGAESHRGGEAQAEGEGLLEDMMTSRGPGSLAGASSVGQGGGGSVAWMSGATEPEGFYVLIQHYGHSA